MSDVSVALTALRYEDAAELAGIDAEVLRPREGSEPKAWLVAVLEHLAGRRTYATEIHRRAAAGNDIEAIRLSIRAASRSVPLPSSAEGELAGVWAAQSGRFDREAAEVRARLEAMRPDAPEAVDLAHIYKDEVDALGALGPRPHTVAAFDAAYANLSRLDNLRRETELLAADADREAEERARKMRGIAVRAFERLLDSVLGAAPSQAGARLIEMLPPLVLERRFELLESIVTGNLDDLAVQLGSAGFTAHVPRVARLVSHPPPAAPPRPAEKELSTASRTQWANTPPAERGLGSAEEVRAFEHDAGRLPDDRAANGWLSQVTPTQDPHLRALALGRGLLALGRHHLLERRNPRIAYMHINDALACLLDAGPQRSPFDMPRAIVPLVVAKSWERLPADVVGSRIRLQEWIDSPDTLFGWIQRAAQHDVVARLWSEAKRDDGAHELLTITDEHMADGAAALLRACARALLSSPQRLSAEPDLVFRRIKELLRAASPDVALIRCLDKMSDEIAGIELGSIAPQSAKFLQEKLDEALASIEALPKDTAAPVSEIAEQLPPLMDALLKGATHEARPRLHVAPVVGAVFPHRRSEEIRLPVRVSNGSGAAPVQDVHLQLSIITDGLQKLPVHFTDGGLSEERAVGSLDSGDEVDVSSFVDLPAGLLQHVAEVRFRATLRVGDKAVEDTTFGVPLRPSNGTPKSPYATGVAVTGDQFVGREKEVQSVCDAIGGDGVGRTPLVYGIRRIGKTSILMQVMLDEHIKARFTPIYMSFEDWSPSKTVVDLLRYICDQVREKLPGPLQAKLAFSQRAFTEDPYIAFERFFRSLDALRPSKRVLLILDEFDKLIHLVRLAEERSPQAPGPPRPQETLESEVFGALRKVIMTSQFVRMIFAGLPAILHSRYEDRLFGLLVPIRVKPFTDKEASRILDAAGDVMTFDPRARDKLIDATGRQPYLLQLACHDLFCSMLEEGRNKVTPADVDAMVQRDLLPYEKYFTDYLKLINEADTPVFRAIARVQREAQHRRKFVSVDEIVRELSREGRAMSRAELEDFVAAHETEERPLIERSPNARHRFRLAVGLIGDFLLRGVA
jgi:hypothetical protein